MKNTKNLFQKFKAVKRTKKKIFLKVKYKNLFDYLVKIQKKIHVFLDAFTWNPLLYNQSLLQNCGLVNLAFALQHHKSIQGYTSEVGSVTPLRVAAVDNTC